MNIGSEHIVRNRRFVGRVALAAWAIAVLLGVPTAAHKGESGLGGAPPWAHVLQNPYEGDGDAIRAGRKLFVRECAPCHGDAGQGKKAAPALDSGRVRRAPPGDLFWVLTNGDLRAGMPAWSRLPEARRWQIVTYLKALAAVQEQSKSATRP